MFPGSGVGTLLAEAAVELDVVRGQGVVRLIGDLAVAEVVGEAGVGGEA